MKKIVFLIAFLSVGFLHAQVSPSDSGYIQFVGNRTLMFVDSTRSNRNVSSLVYYPATAEGSNTALLQGNKFPVISFGHGFTLNPNLYVSIFRHLASWGFIVIAPSTETGFAPNHTNFAKDLVFVLKDMKRKGNNNGDIFYNVIDTNYTGVFGHSMGGGCSFLAGSMDSSIKAVSSLAAANTNPSSITAMKLIKNPVQLLSGQRDSIASYWTHQLPHYKNGFPFKQTINLKGANHSYFHSIAGLDDLIDNPATITRSEQQRLTRKYITAFFNMFLKNDTGYQSILYGAKAMMDTSVIMQFRNFSLKALIQGFYNESSNTMIGDTIRIFLRNVSSPYSIIDSSVSFLNDTGNAALNFPAAKNGVNYYLQLSHRNSIETWSKSGGEIFNITNSNFNFTATSTSAFGNNQVLKGSRYCIYNGDVNIDGVVDVSDLLNTYNDVTNFILGYVVTDINGEGIVDVSDLLIVYNNSSAFVSRIIP
ncbi:MAG: dienelactone hydrolase family protein [bacterium]|nr:dienelactone hydrolase family protein [bacterium]